MFNFIRHRGSNYILSEKSKANKRENLQTILKILAACEGTTPGEATKFSKQNPVNWTDEKVNIIYKKLKLLQWK